MIAIKLLLLFYYYVNILSLQQPTLMILIFTSSFSNYDPDNDLIGEDIIFHQWLIFKSNTKLTTLLCTC